jgi:Ca2+-binding RTX toxin-like protein
VAGWLNYFYGGKTLVYGTHNSETLTGIDGDDHILALSGNDTVNAGKGNDLIEGDWGKDVINGGAGDDLIFGQGEDDTLDGGEGSDDYVVSGNEAEGWSSFQGYDTYLDTGSSGTDRIVAQGGAVDIGLKQFTPANGIEVIDGAGATGEVRLLGDWKANTLDFSATEFSTANISIVGGYGNDTIIGTQDGDIIRGGGDNDKLDGAGGSDDYVVTGNEAEGWSSFQGYDEYLDTGSTGVDYIVAEGAAVDIGFKKFGSANGIEVIDATGATGKVRLLGDWESNTLDFSATKLLGTNIVIDGGYGKDTITGSQGDNTILGGGDNDKLDGVNGSDTYLVTGNEAAGWSSFQGYDEYLDTGSNGTDRILAQGAAVNIGLKKFAPANGIEVIDATGATGKVRLLGDWESNTLDFSATELVGSNIVIDGGHGNDTIAGSKGNDTILGGGGYDKLDGLNGSDTYLVTGNEAAGWSSFQGYDEYLDTGSNGTDRILAQGAAVDIGLKKFAPANGIEVIDASGATGKVRLLGDWESNTLDFSATELVGSNIVIDGGHGNDTITGNKDSNTILGGGGNDSIVGGLGADSLTGGSGWDHFVFFSSAEIDKDTITDFHKVEDKLNLSAIDANTLVAGDQAFVYIAGAIFSGQAGQLRLANGILAGDTNGDRLNDFELYLTGVSTLTANNFIL